MISLIILCTVPDQTNISLSTNKKLLEGCPFLELASSLRLSKLESADLKIDDYWTLSRLDGWSSASSSSFQEVYWNLEIEIFDELSNISFILWLKYLGKSVLIILRSLDSLVGSGLKVTDEIIALEGVVWDMREPF